MNGYYRKWSQLLSLPVPPLRVKKQGTRNFNHFPFLRLYNVCYKIIAKIKMQRLKPLLGKLIDPTQITFVPN